MIDLGAYSSLVEKGQLISKEERRIIEEESREFWTSQRAKHKKRIEEYEKYMQGLTKGEK